MQNKLKKLQQQLKELHYYDGVIDGLWGQASQESLLKAVRENAIKVYFDFTKFKQLFKLSKLTQEVVDSINILFNTFNNYANSSDNLLKNAVNPLYISYMLATTWYETAHTMLPVSEIGSDKYLSKYDTGRLAKNLGNTPEADGDGMKYKGRGYSQITGKRNYTLFTNLLGVDLINNPEYTLKPEVAAKILVLGSLKGLFTGVKLSNYIKVGRLEEFYDCRRVINGTDRAGDIQNYVDEFLNCLVLTPV